MSRDERVVVLELRHGKAFCIFCNLGAVDEMDNLVEEAD
jgi:hypothetical protein